MCGSKIKTCNFTNSRQIHGKFILIQGCQFWKLVLDAISKDLLKHSPFGARVSSVVTAAAFADMRPRIGFLAAPTSQGHPNGTAKCSLGVTTRYTANKCALLPTFSLCHCHSNNKVEGEKIHLLGKVWLLQGPDEMSFQPLKSKESHPGCETLSLNH